MHYEMHVVQILKASAKHFWILTFRKPIRGTTGGIVITTRLGCYRNHKMAFDIIFTNLISVFLIVKFASA